MALYPTCIHCYESVSDLDVEGFCTRCSVASKRSNADQTKVPNGSTRLEPSPDLTKTGKPDASLPKSNSERQFDNYRDVTYLDRGGMGTIYRAIQEKTERVVAIKTMNVSQDRDRRQGQRFLTESRAIARVSHPNIVQIYEVSENESSQFFSMEYVSGGSLSRRLKNGPDISITEAVKITAQIASALAAAHSHKIIHRDIKPSNILLTEAGKPKLTDFGLAVFYEQSERMTNTGATLGTPAYMSPEQASGKSMEVGPASDIYSLGVTLYELLTGQTPFTNANPVAVAVKIVNEKPAQLRTIDPTIPRELEEICLRCLEKNPEDRYESAAELSNDLFRFLRQEPVGKPRFRYRLRKFVRTYRLLLIGIGLALLAGTTAIIAKPEQPVDRVVRLMKRPSQFELPLNELGVPSYHRWTGMPGRLGRIAPGTWGVASENITCLELCPDSWTDHYQIECEVRQMSAGQNLRGHIGFYFLRHSPDPDPAPIRRYFVVQFRDWPIIPNVLKQKRMFQAVSFFPTADQHDHASMGYQFDVDQKEYLSQDLKEWRKLFIDISTEKVVTRLSDKHGQLIAELTDPKQRLALFPKDLCEQPYIIDLGGEGAIPAWQSRCRFGIYVEEASAEFRNLTITPKP